MTLLAHFTAHELPGTLAIFATGLFLGAWFAGSRSPIDWLVALRRRIKTRQG